MSTEQAGATVGPEAAGRLAAAPGRGVEQGDQGVGVLRAGGTIGTRDREGTKILHLSWLWQAQR